MATISNTLNNKIVIANFLQVVKNHTIKWENENIALRTNFLQDLANQLTDSINIPRISVDVTKKNNATKDSFYTLGIFEPKYKININYDRASISKTDTGELARAESDSAKTDFYKLATQLYHEVRHAEQFIRGAQYYYQIYSKRPSAELSKLNNELKLNPNLDPNFDSRFDPKNVLFRDFEIPNNIIQSNIVDRLKNPLSANGYLDLPTNRLDFAKRMFKNMIGYSYVNGSNVNNEYASRPAEQDAYVFSRQISIILNGGTPIKQLNGSIWNSRQFAQIGKADDLADGVRASTLSQYIRFDSKDKNRILVDGNPIVSSFTSSSLTEIDGDLANNSLDFSLSSTQLTAPGYLVSGKEGDDSIIGSNQNDYLFGDEGDDTIEGGTGNDQLDGGTGDDLLQGGNGNDQLDGGTGNDTLIGGLGEDTYYIDNAGDSIQGEDSISGIDTVYSSISINLAANLENLILTGIGNITGAGNSLDNSLTGNDQKNILNGLGGDDLIYGAGGDDDLYGGDGDDYLYGDDEPSTIDGNDSFSIVASAGKSMISDSSGNYDILYVSRPSKYIKHTHPYSKLLLVPWSIINTVRRLFRYSPATTVTTLYVVIIYLLFCDVSLAASKQRILNTHSSDLMLTERALISERVVMKQFLAKDEKKMISTKSILGRSNNSIQYDLIAKDIIKLLRLFNSPDITPLRLSNIIRGGDCRDGYECSIVIGSFTKNNEVQGRTFDGMSSKKYFQRIYIYTEKDNRNKTSEIIIQIKDEYSKIFTVSKLYSLLTTEKFQQIDKVRFANCDGPCKGGRRQYLIDIKSEDLLLSTKGYKVVIEVYARISKKNNGLPVKFGREELLSIKLRTVD
jgi:Ca2+-binding RTX toxin-like protein